MYDSEGGGGGGTSWFRTNAAFSNSAGEINENQINPDPASPTERLKVRLRLHIWLTSSIWMKREHSQTTTTPPSCCSKCGFPQCSTGQWVCMFVRLFCELLGAQIRTMQQWRMEFNFLFFLQVIGQHTAQWLEQDWPSEAMLGQVFTLRPSAAISWIFYGQ